MAQTVIIHSRAGDGFRRAGMAHPVGRAEYPRSQFTDEQMALLEGEPLLDVEVRGEPDAPAETGTAVAAPATPGADPKKAGKKAAE